MADPERNNRDLLRDFRQNQNEEYATETAPVRIRSDREETNTESTAGGAIAGYVALALAIMSFFTYPVIFGIGAVLLGMYARGRGAKTTGNFAIVLGAAAAVLALIFRVALAAFFLSLF